MTPLYSFVPRDSYLIFSPIAYNFLALDPLGSKFLKMKPQQFIDEYLRIDEENDYVLQQVPCTFLGYDNKCMIYEVRPKACAEFPHTDRRKFQQISNLTLKNVAICPAAYNIVEEMKKRIK